MSIRFKNQLFYFNKVQEVHDDISNPAHSYMRVSLSSSRKRSDTGLREYSDWFAVIRGKALEVAKTLSKGRFCELQWSCGKSPI